MPSLYGANRIMSVNDSPRSEPETRPIASEEPDPTGASDISYYRHATFGQRLTVEAGRRARRARREAIALVPVVVGVVLLWKYRESLFGTDTPIRIAAAILIAAIGWRFARDLGRAMGPRLLSRFEPGVASTVSFRVQLAAL